MSLFLPFNYNPKVTEVKTTSYTIPAGEYALIVTATDDLAINGTAIGTGNAAGQIPVTSGDVITGAKFTVARYEVA